MVLDRIIKAFIHVSNALHKALGRLFENIELGTFLFYLRIELLRIRGNNLSRGVVDMPCVLYIDNVVIHAVNLNGVLHNPHCRKRGIHRVRRNLSVVCYRRAGIHIARSVKQKHDVERLGYNLGTSNGGSRGKRGEGYKGVIGVVILNDNWLGCAGDISKLGIAVPHGLIGPHTTGGLGVPISRVC